MKTLRQYQEGKFTIEKEDFIFLDKFELLFEKLKNDREVIKFNPKREDTKEEILKLFNILERFDKSIILSSNPDTDIPCIKREYLLQDEIPYSEELQSKLEGYDLEFFLEESILDNIPKNTKIYCHSVIKNHPNLIMIPLGRDFKGKNVIYSENFDLSSDRDILCYYNCSIPPMSIHWYGRIRSHINDHIDDKDFIKKDNIDIVNSRNFRDPEYLKYYRTLSKSKFMLCPRGCGLDTYRLWDCLYMGCIPIVVKYEGYENFTDLPILFIDKWEDYLDLKEDFLILKYNEMLNSIFNYEKLKFSYWENLITEDIF